MFFAVVMAGPSGFAVSGASVAAVFVVSRQETGGVLLPDDERLLPNSEVLNQELAEVPSVDPPAAPHSSSPGDTSASGER